MANSAGPDQTAQSGLGLNYFPRPICVKTKDHYSSLRYILVHVSFWCMFQFYTTEISNVFSGPSLLTLVIFQFEPPHDKTNKMTVRPAKTQISLGIHPV